MAFVHCGDRATSLPARHLAGCSGVLQTDGYAAYNPHPLVDGHLQSRHDELLPWAYAAQPIAVAA